VEISLLSAFLGGALALLSPCGALLLPAFFASTVGTGSRLAVHGALFTLGLLLVLIPLGIGAGALGALFTTHRTPIVAASAVVLVALGVLSLLGIGFDTGRLLPGTTRLQRSAATSTGMLKSLLLGAASGIGGFCAGPILGAVLTLAAAQGSLVSSGLLLAVYGLGMVVPLLLLAVVWSRLGDNARRRLRGRSITVFGRELHTTSIISGLLIIAVGIMFWTTNGLVDAPSLVPLETQSWLQGLASGITGPAADIAFVLALAGGLILAWALVRARAARRRRTAQQAHVEQASERDDAATETHDDRTGDSPTPPQPTKRSAP